MWGAGRDLCLAVFLTRLGGPPWPWPHPGSWEGGVGWLREPGSPGDPLHTPAHCPSPLGCQGRWSARMEGSSQTATGLRLARAGPPPTAPTKGSGDGGAVLGSPHRPDKPLAGATGPAPLSVMQRLAPVQPFQKCQKQAGPSPTHINTVIKTQPIILIMHPNDKAMNIHGQSLEVRGELQQGRCRRRLAFLYGWG